VEKQLLKRARERWDAQEWLRAAELYEQVLAHYPDEAPSAAWWYDAALAYKFLRDWATARDAWEGFGITVPEGDGEINGAFGPACVRLDTGGEREVVWIQRLCPTRGRVVNVPATKGRRFGEIVVHDGEPTGRRTYDGRSVAVFDELQRGQRRPGRGRCAGARRFADRLAGRPRGRGPAAAGRVGEGRPTRMERAGAGRLTPAGPSGRPCRGTGRAGHSSKEFWSP
jgi:hypothetical protein